MISNQQRYAQSVKKAHITSKKKRVKNEFIQKKKLFNPKYFLTPQFFPSAI